MSQRRILYVEDDDRLREQTRMHFETRGWHVDTAQHGGEALDRIEQTSVPYDVMVLDLRMPGMGGEGLLEAISDKNIEAPPTIVLSAYSTKETADKCRYLGVVHTLAKPYSAADLERMAELAAQGVPIDNIPTHFSMTTVDYAVRRREEALKEHLKTIADNTPRKQRPSEPIFVIGRRWNSWYPSVFPVPGGAYAVVAPESAKDTQHYTKGATPAVVIDPGFRFLEVFRDLGISVADMECCIISHNHPDHMGGIFEFMAARHAFGKKTRAFCNPSASDMLGDCAGFSLEVKTLDNKYVDAISSYPTAKDWLQIRVKGFDTFHEEIGRQNASKGLIITLQAGKDNMNMEDQASVAIVGDTAYDRAEHHDALIPIICNHNIKAVVLHIGCSQFKQATGKHLYLRGLKDILNDMDSHLIKIRYPGKLLVAISEWGLEHATKKQLTAACGISLGGFNNVSPIQETVHLLQEELKKVVLLPADIGLIVGMSSGLVHLQNGPVTTAEEVEFIVTDNGLKYQAAASISS